MTVTAVNGTSNETPPELSKQSIHQRAQQYSTPNAKPTAWDTPGSASCDFRSDVVTTPTASMLQSIAATTLLDDVFLEDPTTKGLEEFCAALTGKEAALLVTSGTMGNQVAIRTHMTTPPSSLVCDSRSHIMNWEAGGLATTSQALSLPIHPTNTHHLTLPDIRTHTVLSSDIHACPTKLICLENTLNGTIFPLPDAQEISHFARANGVSIHLDGARLWEAASTAPDPTEHLKSFCACFDSISLCFSKGLGAPIGSILVGSKSFIDRARQIRKMLGGGTRQAGVIAAPAMVAVRETFLGGTLKRSHERARGMARLWESLGGKLLHPTETNMVWLDLGGVGEGGMSSEMFITMAAEEGLRVMGGRLVVHYQIGDEAVGRFGRLARRILRGPDERGGADGADGVEAKRMKLDVE